MVSGAKVPASRGPVAPGRAPGQRALPSTGVSRLRGTPGDGRRGISPRSGPGQAPAPTPRTGRPARPSGTRPWDVAAGRAPLGGGIEARGGDPPGSLPRGLERGGTLLLPVRRKESRRPCLRQQRGKPTRRPFFVLRHRQNLAQSPIPVAQRRLPAAAGGTADPPPLRLLGVPAPVQLRHVRHGLSGGGPPLASREPPAGIANRRRRRTVGSSSQRDAYRTVTPRPLRASLSPPDTRRSAAVPPRAHAGEHSDHVPLPAGARRGRPTGQRPRRSRNAAGGAGRPPPVAQAPLHPPRKDLFPPGPGVARSVLRGHGRGACLGGTLAAWAQGDAPPR
jgi:hypothetical protein